VNALLHGTQRLEPMTVGELNTVAAIEAAAYDFPWTRGNFVDSLAAGYLARVLRDARGVMVGYFVAMKGVDEMHLLNLTVAPAAQGQGHARLMLNELVAMCRSMHARQLWLEVRESNERARLLYTRYGFRHIGVRRGYYPALYGRREDADVMTLDVHGGVDALE
jgi:[ribosomal protein S18]-alanine N-acetyltransferase